MNTYLSALGWWNLIGSFFMLCFFHEETGRKVFNEWTKIFIKPFTLDFWSKFWMAWAIGLNVFFAATNIYAAKWNLYELKLFCVIFDLIAYGIFTCLVLWGVKAKTTGPGIYSVFFIFMAWITWGVFVLLE